jgi:hypothetical protein
MDRGERANANRCLGMIGAQQPAQTGPVESVTAGVCDVGGYLVPVDPMDGLQCDTCQ